jgi:hypothetical protein
MESKFVFDRRSAPGDRSGHQQFVQASISVLAVKIKRAEESMAGWH